MGATESWFAGFTPVFGQPVLHTENDGAVFARKGAQARDDPIAWTGFDNSEQMVEALKAVVTHYEKGDHAPLMYLQNALRKTKTGP